jgi:hypothetical protein
MPTKLTLRIAGLSPDQLDEVVKRVKAGGHSLVVKSQIGGTARAQGVVENKDTPKLHFKTPEFTIEVDQSVIPTLLAKSGIVMMNCTGT